MRETATFVAFLTPNYFHSAWCCLELVQAVESKVHIIFVVLEGATWAKGGAFPAPADVPESIVVHDEEDITLAPRKAFLAVYDAAPRMVQRRSFFASFIDGLQEALGPPPAVDALEGEAKEIWAAAGGGAKLAWPTVHAQLKQRGGGGYAGNVEAVIAKALGVRNADDQAATVSAIAFASLFEGGAKFSELVTALGADASAGADERLLPVTILPAEEGADESDGGLALVGPNTSLEDVRAQLRVAYEEDGKDDELLRTGRFTFLATAAREPVRRKQEKLIRGPQIDNPVAIKADKNAKLSSGKEGAPADEGKESEADASKAAAAKAAKELIAAGARREAGMLTLDEVMRDPLRAASLRRHAAGAATEAAKGDKAAAKEARAEAERHAQLAIQALTLNDALVESNQPKALAVAEQLRGFIRADAALAAKIPAGAPPQAIAAALREREMAARLALTPALERMRSEMLKAAGGGAIKGSVQSADLKGLKRVVVLGGGPCGATVAHQLIHIHPGFHVTIVDTKEYYEDTPSVLRMMTGVGHKDVDELWPHLCISFADIMRDAKNATFINGTAVAVRKDHLLVGTTNGIASQVVPFDYLVLSTGTSYRSDIKTDGASIAHRKKSFEVERERMAEVDSFAIIGAGLVGIELAGDLKSYFPDKPVNVYTKAGGYLPRVPGAHDRVAPVCENLGIDITVGKEIISTTEDGRLVAKDGEIVGPQRAHVLVHRLHAQLAVHRRSALRRRRAHGARREGLHQDRQGHAPRRGQGARPHLRGGRPRLLRAPLKRRAHGRWGVDSCWRHRRQHPPRGRQARRRPQDARRQLLRWHRRRRVARHQRRLHVRHQSSLRDVLPG